MKTENKLFRISEIQRFCMHDGPGIRTTVFFSGCPLRCEWCHNPESRLLRNRVMLYTSKCIGCARCACVCGEKAQIFGKERKIDRERCKACFECVEACPTGALERAFTEYTLDALTDILLRDRAFYGECGGVTLSGGEPLFSPECALALLKKLKQNGINTAIESCGYADTEVVEKAVPDTDLFLWDFKLGSSSGHRKYTGVPNDKIIENIRYADSLGAKSVLHCIMLNRVNTDNGHYGSVAKLFLSLKNCEYVELLPYHTYGVSKYEALGLDCTAHREWIPSQEDISKAHTLLESLGVKMKK